MVSDEKKAHHCIPVDKMSCLSQIKELPLSKEEHDRATAEVTLAQAVDLPQSNVGGVATSEESERFGNSGDQLSNSSSSSSSVAVSSSTSSSEAKPQPPVTKARGSSTVADPQQVDSTVGSDAGARLVQAEVHSSLENGEKEPPESSPSSGEMGADSERQDDDEDNDEDGSKKEDYSEGDLVDISAYSGIGEEDSGGSQLDDEEDEEDEEAYQPETSCSEIEGLPEEEEPMPTNRKIRFSTEPIRVSDL